MNEIQLEAVAVYLSSCICFERRSNTVGELRAVLDNLVLDGDLEGWTCQEFDAIWNMVCERVDFLGIEPPTPQEKVESAWHFYEATTPSNYKRLYLGEWTPPVIS